MSATTDLARGIARLLLDFADRTDAVADHKSEEEELPPIPLSATAQRRVAEVLAIVGHQVKTGELLLKLSPEM